jgi:predicted ATPase
VNAKLLELRVRGLRTLADVTLPLSGLTVLIGENGAGKSSLIEAFQLARLLAGQGWDEQVDRQVGRHSLGSAVRSTSGELRIDVRVEFQGRNLTYSVALEHPGGWISAEELREIPEGVRLSEVDADPKELAGRALIKRQSSSLLLVETGDDQQIAGRTTLFEYFGGRPPIELAGVAAALAGIDVQLPFAVTSGWANRMMSSGPSPREPQVLEPTSRLHLFGRNLANAYHTLKNNGSQRWQTTLELLRLGLGPDLLDVQTPTAGGGHVSLAVEFAGSVGQITAFQLSDGQLAYLAFVALVQLDPGRTLLCFDEPEQHLHPALLARVLQLFEDASTRHPVVIATHSDRLLDYLSDPVASVLVCELDAERRTTLRRLDQAQLDKWLESYGGVGEIRAGGQLGSILADGDEDGGS